MQELARQAKVLSLVKEVRLRQPRIGGRKLQHIIAPKLAESGRQIGRECWLCHVVRIIKRQTVITDSDGIPIC